MAQPHQERLLTRDFNLAFTANLLQEMSFFLFIHLPRFVTDLGGDEIVVGVLFSVTAVASIVVRPWIGDAMDTRGRKPVILVGGIVNLAAILGYLLVSSIGPWLYVVRIVHGVAIAILFTALFTYGADVVPESRRTQGLALFGISGFIPIALGGLLGDLILARWGFTELFVTAAVFGALVIVISLGLTERATGDGDTTRQGFFKAIALPRLRPVWWFSLIWAFSVTSYFAFIRTYVDAAGFGSVGLFFAVYSGVAILLRIFFGWVPDRYGLKRVLYPATASLVLGFLVLSGATEPAHVAVAGALCGLGHGYIFPILFTFTVTRTPLADRGSSVAFFTALFDVGALVAGPLLGLVIAGQGYSAMFSLAAALLVVGAVVFAIWDRPQVEAVAADS